MDRGIAPAPECPGCFQSDAAPRYAGRIAMTTLGTMRAGTRGGCSSCAALLDGLHKCVPSVATMEDGAQVRAQFNAHGRRSLDLVLMRPPSSPTTVSFFTTKGLSQVPDSPRISRLLPDCPLGHDLPPSTSSDESLDWARERLATCEATHVKCRGSSAVTIDVDAAAATTSTTTTASTDTTTPPGPPLFPLPTRVVDVGTSAGDPLRLYETRREPGRYACLSYCWGPAPFLRTVRANLAAHRDDGIPCDAALPTTQREAVAVARALGIRYLWIDSLCIVQDDGADWQREAARMADIYRGACVVLSASKGAAADDGLFSTAAAAARPSMRLHRVAVLDEGRKRRTETAEEDQVLYARIRPAHVEDAGASSAAALPIVTRGWTFQERFLAARVLHFNPDELAWECLETSACQCAGTHALLPAGRASASRLAKYAALSGGGDGGPAPIPQPKALYHPSGWAGLDEPAFRRRWHAVVQDYASRQLTYRRDVFPAVAGLAARAKALRPATVGRYVAGLWERSLRADLCWYREKVALVAARHDNADDHSDDDGDDSAWVAPSWSWACAEGPLSFVTADDPVDDDDSCRIVDIHLELASDANPVGRLLDARLVLRGLLVPTELGFRPRQHLDTPSPWQILDLGLFRGRMGNQYADYDPRAEQGPDGLQAGSTVYLFRIGRVLPSDALCFLVLRRVRADGGEAVYKRIGLAELFVRQFGQVDVVKEVRSLGEETVVTIV